MVDPRVQAPMTDEEVLKIAQGLSAHEWRVLRFNANYATTFYCAVNDPPLVKLDLVYVEGYQSRVTPLGYRVLEWRDLFAPRM